MIMKHFVFVSLLSITLFLSVPFSMKGKVKFLPAPNAIGVNADTHLTIGFSGIPVLGKKGCIRIFDAATNRQVDCLDLSIPAGPTMSAPKIEGVTYTKVPYDYSRTSVPTNRTVKAGTPSGTAEATSTQYQLTVIGGFTDGFHFYPVLIRGCRAVIYPHNQMLEPGKRYYVRIDKGVLSCPADRFDGIQDTHTWSFTTAATPALRDTLIVNADGSGNFSTVQGAMDAIPDFSKKPVTVYIKNGDYEELVYFRNKSNVTIVGESRDGVIVHYATNEVFNPHPRNVLTNEVPGTFPSRRSPFTMDNCTDMTMKNLTVKTDFKGQAEGLLIMGTRNYLDNVHIIGDGDALQVNGPVYLNNCLIDGGGDTILGRGPAYFYRCTLSNAAGPFIWVRNTEANHGDVFVECIFRNTFGKMESALARSPKNGQKYYPYAEAVLIDCQMENILPEGWLTVEGDVTHNHFWEFNSCDAKGNPTDISQRNTASRQLLQPQDEQLIRNYRNPEFVLGWKPGKAN